jgi:AcrR family transcriptional regulator
VAKWSVASTIKQLLHSRQQSTCFTAPRNLCFNAFVSAPSAKAGHSEVEELPARELLMDTAERLIAERGMGVSLREIAARAGQRNNSAVIYYFGNHDGLIAATLGRRMTELDDRRRVLLAELDAQADYDLADVLRAIIEPALDLPYRSGATHYARFVEQIRTHPILASSLPSSESWPATMALAGRLRFCLPSYPRRDLSRRIGLMAITMFALMADYERRGELDSVRGRKRACRELVEVLAAVLKA